MDKIEEILTRGVDEVIDQKDLEVKLRSGKKLRVKLGIDPTSPNIHIGRARALWKMRAFQELGHTAIFIVGDFTGMIGDTSDKDSERPMLTEKEVKANGSTYFAQAFKILDKKKTEVYYNSKWLKKLGFLELAKISNLFGLNQFASREVIARRMKADKRVSYLELMYPIMQGYDSVAVRADLELGGTDQRFNLLTGRDIQKFYKQQPQDIMMLKLMEGTDGRKMSSSWGNVINITDEPNDMFGKVMSINDGLINKYFILATRTPLPEIDRVTKELQNPRDQKLFLAQTITAMYHGEELAIQAKDAFVSQFSKGELPSDIPVKILSADIIKVTDVIVAAGLAASKSEARRLIEQGGVKLDGKVVADDKITIGNKEQLLQVGKRKFAKVKSKK
jgi:tyrosyl-tRNA synthetase